MPLATLCFQAINLRSTQPRPLFEISAALLDNIGFSHERMRAIKVFIPDNRPLSVLHQVFPNITELELIRPTSHAQREIRTISFQFIHENFPQLVALSLSEFLVAMPDYGDVRLSNLKRFSMRRLGGRDTTEDELFWILRSLPSESLLELRMHLKPEEGALDKVEFFIHQMFKSLVELDIGSAVRFVVFVDVFLSAVWGVNLNELFPWPDFCKMCSFFACRRCKIN